MATRRVLIRAGRPPHDTTPNEGASSWGPWGHFAHNAGNMVFSDAVYEALNTPGTEVTCDAYVPERIDLTRQQADEVSERYDVYVIPLANAFRTDFGRGPLERLTRFVEMLSIPVVVTGVGGQGDIGGGAEQLPDDVQETVRRFMRAVLERSTSVGVRGESTRKLLEQLGFSAPEVDVIGCPSLFRMGREFSIEKRVDRISTDSPLSINHESKLPQAGEFYLENERRYSDLVSVMQTLYGAQLLLWGEDMPKAFTAGQPGSVDDAAYREGRMRFFTNPRPWREFLAARDFSFGTRIHGNITALQAGTPAFVLTTDLRTQELADYHGIPSAPFETTIAGGRFLAEHLYDRADYSEFNARMPMNWDHYYAFFETNGLEHIHQPGHENPRYRMELAAAPVATGITPISASDVPGVSSRLRWLWQGREADRLRPAGSYRPGFEFDRTDIRSPQQKLDWVGRQLAELRATNARLEERVAELEGFKNYLNRPVGERMREAIARRLPGRRG